MKHSETIWSTLVDRNHQDDYSRFDQKRCIGKKPETMPIGSMYAIYGNIYHQYTPNVSIYTIHGSYGLYNVEPRQWFANLPMAKD